MLKVLEGEGDTCSGCTAPALTQPGPSSRVSGGLSHLPQGCTSSTHSKHSLWIVPKANRSYPAVPRRVREQGRLPCCSPLLQ